MSLLVRVTSKRLSVTGELSTPCIRKGVNGYSALTCDKTETGTKPETVLSVSGSPFSHNLSYAILFHF